MTAAWSTIPLGEVIAFQRGFDLPHRDRKHGSVPIVSSAGITDFHAVAMCDPPGVVTGRYGTIGELFFITQPYWPLNTTLFIKDFRGNDPSFIYFLLQTFDFRSFSGKSGVPGVNRNDLHEEKVLIPRLINEQRAIAAALSDADAAVEGLEQLIAKKRDIKQAVMQQLLTGQTRLPGFSVEWGVKRLGDIASIKTGPFGAQLHEKDYVRSGIPIITVEHLCEYGVDVSRGVPMVSEADRKRLSNYHLIDGDIVLSRVGSIDRNALIRTEQMGWLFSGRLLRLRFVPSISPSFMSHLFNSSPFKKEVLEVAVGQTMASLNTRILSGITVTMPVDASEQLAIATVLSDIDAELIALQAQLDKTRLIKQAMMQELLTGRTRLPYQ